MTVDSTVQVLHFRIIIKEESEDVACTSLVFPIEVVSARNVVIHRLFDQLQGIGIQTKLRFS